MLCGMFPAHNSCSLLAGAAAAVARCQCDAKRRVMKLAHGLEHYSVIRVGANACTRVDPLGRGGATALGFERFIRQYATNATMTVNSTPLRTTMAMK